VAAIQIDNEYKVCQRVSDHDWQKVMRQLKQTAKQEARKGRVQ